MRLEALFFSQNSYLYFMDRLTLRDVSIVDQCGIKELSHFPLKFCMFSVDIVTPFYAVVTTTIRLRFNARSAAYQRSLRSQ